MILISWLFDKLGYMPKISIDSTFPFPVTQKDYMQHEFEKPIKRKPAAKKTVVKKTVKKRT
jgi:hypothetical protein